VAHHTIDMCQTALVVVQVIAGGLPAAVDPALYTDNDLSGFYQAVAEFEWSTCPEMCALPEDARDFVLGCMQRDVHGRPQTGKQALQHRFLAAAAQTVARTADAAAAEWQAAHQQLQILLISDAEYLEGVMAAVDTARMRNSPSDSSHTAVADPATAPSTHTQSASRSRGISSSREPLPAGGEASDIKPGARSSSGSDSSSDGTSCTPPDSCQLSAAVSAIQLGSASDAPAPPLPLPGSSSGVGSQADDVCAPDKPVLAQAPSSSSSGPASSMSSNEPDVEDVQLLVGGRPIHFCGPEAEACLMSVFGLANSRYERHMHTGHCHGTRAAQPSQLFSAHEPRGTVISVLTSTQRCIQAILNTSVTLLMLPCPRPLVSLLLLQAAAAVGFGTRR
jgi:hypothetical protein